ncbi:hypothetical protein TNCT_197231 [Trichonephila clavata]|uniref:Uncharacterized protein n=1 Tax=Trichonephila clavata TaxID=2740835 RepID=A0A8X6JMA2_TRICU|nr:hypothetical protein TNCT_197231 [Trichonephila clavata]
MLKQLSETSMPHLEKGSVRKRTIRRRYTKYESDDGSHTNEYWEKPETVVDNEVLRAIFEKNPCNTVRDYAELGVTVSLDHFLSP